MLRVLEASAAQAAPPRLLWRTQALDPALLPGGPTAPDLLALLAGRNDVVSWVREGRGLVGIGRVLELRAHGPQRIEALRTAWRATVYHSWWSDPLVRPGTGPVALGAVAFSPSSAANSVLVVPELLLGLDEQGAWITQAMLAAGDSETLPEGSAPEVSAPELLRRFVADAEWAPLAAADPVVGGALGSMSPGASATPGPTAGATAPAAACLPAPVGAGLQPGAQGDADWMAAVEQARRALQRGDLEKVVLARDLTVVPTQAGHTGDLLRRLGADYPSCWTFAVDGMVGASPELLVRLRQRRLSSRVLAGTARRHASTPGQREAEAQRLARWLEESAKNNREHALARASALAALRPLCSVVECPERFVLTLPNVLHLASDVTGVVAGDTGALSLVGALHPTAAVCGTPRRTAAALIEELEHMDRGRYAGPVGWVDWHGEGEWCIALRSAQLAGDGSGGLSPDLPLRAFGGGGIMPDSDPADELAETKAKMRPVLDALGAQESP
ncbi:Isochorismate synthase dhbC [Actinomyces bovis]|uniref:Isochorismate synthase dhbC n=1 Tax=Actinomyces bovis TaxID=1658 RepID=A0ABY1VN45_9ACTO|nr:chorismate-binding protein [Actinomyces bovis]SPT53243.1 Isochorismate synthase dhbC [Actinomyces bovis]VEG52502.1 Isochorismate synthase dhbC [Actinomyces israelii]